MTGSAPPEAPPPLSASSAPIPTPPALPQAVAPTSPASPSSPAQPAPDPASAPGAGASESASEPAPPAPAPPAPAVHSCVHCGATETPLWRAGPHGPKTLCNACGVRWKKTGSVIPRARRSGAGARGGAIAKSNTSSRRPSSSAPSTTPAAGAKAKPIPTLPAPVAVRVHETRAGTTGVYESVFAGLMVVPRGGRTRTRTPRAQRFFDGVGARPTAVASPPPEKGAAAAAAGGVYVTETVAPSPSPSPPPIPRVEPFPEGQGFRIVMHVKKDPPGKERGL